MQARMKRADESQRRLRGARGGETRKPGGERACPEAGGCGQEE